MDKAMKQVLVIGGGPSAMMAAISCKQHNPDAHVTLLERNDTLGVKLKLTGGGRCNLTADVSNQQIIKNTPKNGKFLFSTLSQFNTRNIQEFFVSHGCNLKVEDHQRVFPISNKSQDVLNVLINEMNKLHVDVRFNTKITSIEPNNQQAMSENETFSYDHLIIATGGCSYPQTGSDTLGFEMLSEIGHTINDLKPAEVPLVSNEKIIQSKDLMGLSFKDVHLSIFINNNKVISLTNDLLFTHFGLSGPAALQASSYLVNAFENQNEVKVVIDFLPKISKENLQEDCLLKPVEETLMQHGLQRRLIQTLKNDNVDLIESIKKYSLILHGTRGFMHAFVTSGGVDVKEIDPKTMKSKVFNNISICGEAIDVNSLTGGYNMTVAFSTGYVAGFHCLNK